jgi:CRP/FNR family transcriptional regulator
MPSPARLTCSTCKLRGVCLPDGLAPHELQRIDEHMVSARRKVPRGDRLYRAGDRFDTVYAVWTGFFKTSIWARSGRDQVTGFQMNGELLGLDGVAGGRHEVDAVALEDSQVCVVRHEQLDALCEAVPSLRRRFVALMGREFVRTQHVMLLLGSMHAEERVAAFLLDLADRLRVRGFSAHSIMLRMTREEIGSYLGLTLETISRTLSKFQAHGLLFVRNRQVQITDPVGLRQLLDGETEPRTRPLPAFGAAPSQYAAP